MKWRLSARCAPKPHFHVLQENMSLSREQAEETVLRQLNAPRCGSPNEDTFVIQSSELSKNGDFWVIRANSEAFVQRGDFGRCYVGVNAYLVGVEDGDVIIVGSAQDEEDVLQDLYDERAAAGGQYALCSGYETRDKQAIIRLHQLLHCGIASARELVCGSKEEWITGKRRVLRAASEYLASEGIDSVVRLKAGDCLLPELEEFLFASSVGDAIKRRAEPPSGP